MNTSIETIERGSVAHIGYMARILVAAVPPSEPQRDKREPAPRFIGIKRNGCVMPFPRIY